MQVCDTVRTVLPYECLFGISLLLVPFRSRWFHLQLSEMVIFVTIAIANVVFYWAVLLHAVSSYEFLVFYVNSLLSLSRSRWFHLVPGGFNSFQVVPACSGQFHLISACSSFQYVLYKTRTPPFSYYCRLKSCDHVTVLPRAEKVLNEYKVFE